MEIRLGEIMDTNLNSLGTIVSFDDNSVVLEHIVGDRQSRETVTRERIHYFNAKCAVPKCTVPPRLHCDCEYSHCGCVHDHVFVDSGKLYSERVESYKFLRAREANRNA